MHKTEQFYVLNHSEHLGKEPVTWHLVKKYSLYKKYEFFFCIQLDDTTVVGSAVFYKSGENWEYYSANCIHHS